MSTIGNRNRQHVLPSDTFKQELQPSNNLMVNPIKTNADVNMLKFGTINVGTLRNRIDWLAETLQNENILVACVQETLLTALELSNSIVYKETEKFGEIDLGYRIYCEPTEEAHNGVAIVVDETLKESFVEVKPISDRLISLILNIEERRVCIVSCYAPHSGRPQKEKDIFWKALDSLLEEVQLVDFLMIGGDFNGHVGKNTVADYEECHEGFGYGEKNPDGTRILKFAKKHNLVLTNTCFPLEEDELITFYASNRRTQIDYCLIRRCNREMLTMAKVFPNYKISDYGHRLLISTLDRNLLRNFNPQDPPTRENLNAIMLDVRRIVQEKAAENFPVKPPENKSVEKVPSIRQVFVERLKGLSPQVTQDKVPKKFLDKLCGCKSVNKVPGIGTEFAKRLNGLPVPVTQACQLLDIYIQMKREYGDSEKFKEALRTWCRMKPNQFRHADDCCSALEKYINKFGT